MSEPCILPWRFLLGMALLFLAYCLAVGSGMEPHVEHDRARQLHFAIAGGMAIAGMALLWLSLWPGPGKPKSPTEE